MTTLSLALLDTDILSAVMRKNPAPVSDRNQGLNRASILKSGISGQGFQQS
jgi:hypothetical protein